MTKRQAASKARRVEATRGSTEATHRPFSSLVGAKLAKTSRRAAAERSPSAPPVEPAADGERLRFAQLIRGVKPLDATTDRAARDTAPAQAEGGARARLEALVAEGIRFEVVDDGESLEGRRLDVDPREIRKLRQLRYAVDGTLDLHGLTAAEARTKVESFLRRRRLQGDRAVVIVHGKGSHSPRGVAILRGELAAWLSQGKAQRDVAAFASVTDRLGGHGAVCVLLAR